MHTSLIVLASTTFMIVLFRRSVLCHGYPWGVLTVVPTTTTTTARSTRPWQRMSLLSHRPLYHQRHQDSDCQEMQQPAVDTMKRMIALSTSSSNNNQEYYADVLRVGGEEAAETDGGLSSSALLHQQRQNTDGTPLNERSSPLPLTHRDDVPRSNQDLVQQRLAMAQAKRMVQQRAKQQLFERQLQIRQQLHRDLESNQPANDTQPLNSNTSASATTSPSPSSGIDCTTIAHEQSIGSSLTPSSSIRSTASSSMTTEMYAIKVSIDESIRQELRLSGREKRGRIFVETNHPATWSIQELQKEIHGSFRALKRVPYMLMAGYPPLVPMKPTSSSSSSSSSSSIQSSTTSNSTSTNESPITGPTTTSFWPIHTDDDTVQTFHKVQEYYRQHQDMLQRPSMLLHIRRDPTIPPTPIPHWLLDIPNPGDSPTISMISFYAFPPGGIVDPEEFAIQLKRLWKPFHVLGRVYVAQEGINAQMSIPTNVLSHFQQCCQNIMELGLYMENGINIDPIALTRAEYAIAGTPGTGGRPQPPFTNLHIRVRRQIVADGLGNTLNWQNSGSDIPPLQWHTLLKQSQTNQSSSSNSSGSNSNNSTIITTHSSSKAMILLDCRNSYETELGYFEGSEPLNTDNFRDSWSVLQNRLKDVPKDTPIYGYCTGGIRCVKVGAYLTQELGFTNFNRLAGGIIGYDRVLKEEAPEESSLFRGTNFVFDGRLGRPITEDALGVCLTCGNETSLVSNCCNDRCHRRMIQCENCRASYLGTCSDPCRIRVTNDNMRPKQTAPQPMTLSINKQSEEITSTTKRFQNLIEYSQGHSSPIPSIYPEMEMNTKALIPTGAHMISGRSQGRLLTQLASMTRHGRILELGTFTGYATACLLEGAAHVGKVLDIVGNRTHGPFVMSLERDERAYQVAVDQLNIMAQYGTGSDAAEAMCALRTLSSATINRQGVQPRVELVLERFATCELVLVTDALAEIESMAAGVDLVAKEQEDQAFPIAPFDMVFLDADKARLSDYVEVCLSTDRILQKGGLIVVDNVLWKGLVLDCGRTSDTDEVGSDDDKSYDESVTSVPLSQNGIQELYEGDRNPLWSNDNLDLNEIRKSRRARKLAHQMHTFNQAMACNEHVEVIVLPIRDGLSVIRKK